MSENPGEGVNTIRRSNRDILVMNRRRVRGDVADTSRSMEYIWQEFKITPEAVSVVAKKLIGRDPVTLAELLLLKNAFHDDPSNIELFLKTHGTIRGLVRELTGCDTNRQIAAVGCFCNLGLGKPTSTVAVVKAAAHYLIPGFDNHNVEYAVTCAWTIGNLAGSCELASDMLSSQGAGGKLVQIMSSPHRSLREAGLYAAVRYTYKMKDNLATDHLVGFFQAIPKIDVEETAQLMFILSCHKEFSSDFISRPHLIKITRYTCDNLLKVGNQQKDTVMDFLKVIGNINSRDKYNLFLDYIIRRNMIKLFRELTATNEILMWLFGNIYKLCSDNVFFGKFLK